MSWTKRQFVEQAFEEIGYASYVFDLQPEQLQAAMRRLDAMMATWNGKGIALGYPLPSSPQDADLDTETEVPDWAAEAISLNLASRIAPIVGKIASADTKSSARAAYNTVLSKVTHPREKQLPRTMPVGSGNKPWRCEDPFIQPEDNGVILPPDYEVDFDG